MSLEEEMKFWDATPHRLQIQTYSDYDNNGRRKVNLEDVRVYRCLISNNASMARGVSGNTLSVGLTAWCLATPMTQTKPWGVTTEDKAHFVNPLGMEDRPIESVEDYYDETGKLHNFVVHFG